MSGIFRLVHTIKGTCGFLGLPRLEKVAHAGENVLSRMRDGSLRPTPALVSLVLAALDRIKLIVADLAATGTEQAGEDGPLIAALDRAAEGETPAPARTEPSAAAASVPITAPAAAAPKPEAVVAGAPEPVVAEAPEAAMPEAPAEVAEPAAGASPRAGAEAAPAAAAPVGAAQTIRVGVDVLEDLMTLVSELVLTRNQLLQLARTQENSAFTVPLQRLSHITSDLQEGVMKTRMQPIGNAWNKLPRLVRDLAHELGKKIELVMLGAETELDRQVLELIKDPLTHMVRNSADHGLESPAERRAAGKPDAGRITLNAFHEGGHIIIEIADDGRGLPVDRIRAKVLAQGLATEAELAGMTRRADPALHLPRRVLHRRRGHRGLRPRRRHGRGQDQYRADRRHHRAARASPAQGTTFTIKIPLTLAIVSALIVEAGGERFAIPQISVVELVRAGGAAAAGAAGGTGRRDRTDQRHPGAAPARPAAAAGQPERPAAARRRDRRRGTADASS